jgi:hypothetical protein
MFTHTIGPFEAHVSFYRDVNHLYFRLPRALRHCCFIGQSSQRTFFVLVLIDQHVLNDLKNQRFSLFITSSLKETKESTSVCSYSIGNFDVWHITAIIFLIELNTSI